MNNTGGTCNEQLKMTDFWDLSVDDKLTICRHETPNYYEQAIVVTLPLTVEPEVSLELSTSKKTISWTEEQFNSQIVGKWSGDDEHTFMPREAYMRGNEATTNKKRKKKKKKKKDPNAPKGALSAFMYFSKAKRPEIKEDNPEASFGEIGKLLGVAWKALSEDDKAEYNEQAAADKLRYKKEMEGYTPPSEEEDEAPKKKAATKKQKTKGSTSDGATSKQLRTGKQLPTMRTTTVLFNDTPLDREALMKLTEVNLKSLLKKAELPMKSKRVEMVDTLLAGKPDYDKYSEEELKHKCKNARLLRFGDKDTIVRRLKMYDSEMAKNGRDKKAALAALHEAGLGSDPSQNNVMIPTEEQKAKIKERIDTVVALTKSMRDEDTNDMDEQQKLRYVCPVKSVVRSKSNNEGDPVGVWINAWKNGNSCANKTKKMGSFEHDLLVEKFQFFSLPDGATSESARNACTFREMVALYNDLVSVPRSREGSWDGVEEHDIVDDKSGVNLSEWGMLQRRLYKDGLLSAEQFDCLNRIRFEFKMYKPLAGGNYYVSHSKHIKSYRCAREYIEELGSEEFNGHIPTNTVVGEINLGQFITAQRRLFNNYKPTRGEGLMFDIGRLLFIRLGFLADASALRPSSSHNEDVLLRASCRNNNLERQRNQLEEEALPGNHDARLFKTTEDVGSTKRAATSNNNNHQSRPPRVSMEAAAAAPFNQMMEEMEAQGGSADTLGANENDDQIVDAMANQAMENIRLGMPALPPLGRDDMPSQDEMDMYASQVNFDATDFFEDDATDFFQNENGSTPIKKDRVSDDL